MIRSSAEESYQVLVKVELSVQDATSQKARYGDEQVLGGRVPCFGRVGLVGLEREGGLFIWNQNKRGPCDDIPKIRSLDSSPL